MVAGALVVTRSRIAAWAAIAFHVAALVALFVVPVVAGGTSVRTGDPPWHLGWTQQLLEGERLPSGPAPPELARNSYPWGFHALIATLVRLVPGTDPLVALTAVHLLVVLGILIAPARFWLLLPAVSYYVFFIGVILYNYDRFLLPIYVLLALLAGSWIHDLAAADPYYVLPILTGVTMVWQQKLTPAGVDPTQQKVMIARWLFAGVKVLILDEPTTVLSPPEVERLLAIARQLAREGKIVVFISHRLQEVFSVSDAISVMRRGKLVGTWPTVDRTSDQIAEARVGHRRERPCRSPPPGSRSRSRGFATRPRRERR